MKNKREQEAIRAYFAQEPVPVEIHNALRQACQQLPPREESPAPAAGKAWRRLGGALSTAAAAFVLLCCLNAVNPAFAESVPLLGRPSACTTARTRWRWAAMWAPIPRWSSPTLPRPRRTPRAWS